MVCPSCGSALPEAARFCPSCGVAAETRPRASEERKVATVLFADLVGSTALGGSQDPERTRAMLDRFYDAMAAEISRAGGTVEKFVGDAVMAVFGAPAAQEDHAERALHAALAMRRRLEELFGGVLRMRIGVNTGEVVVGAAREGSSFVTGDAVNVCARLEQNVEPGEILVGERTASLVRGAFEFGEAGMIEAKGKDGGVACRRLVRALSLMRPRGVGGLRQAFVGRETELELLETTYRRVVEAGEPHLVTLMGDAGIGKTRLVRELWDRLAAQPEEPLRRTGRCLPYGQGITYWPLAEILKEHLGVLETDSPEVVRERLGSHEMLGLTLGLESSEALHPLTARDRLHDAWIEFLRELAGARPVVVLIEDLHWAEEPLLDLLERIAREAHTPVLLIGTARPELLERRPTWGGGRRNASLLWLEPLSPEDSARLVEEEIAGTLPDDLRALIVDGSEGNPFFAEELIATLVDQGVLERVDGSWRANELPEGFAIPDSVQAVLAARIDLLPAVEKSALQAAAVIGRVFWEAPVRELLQGAEPDFELLEDRDFVRRRSGSSMAGEREYAVKHALTREVAYGSLPKARRARLHATFAKWLESRAGGRDELAGLLAHHYAEAVRPEDADLVWTGDEAELAQLVPKAREWLGRAGRLAIARYELEDGIELLERAIALDPPAEVEAELWREIGLAQALRFDGEAFWTAMQESLKVCPSRSVCADTYSLLALHTASRTGMWRTRPDDALVRDWISRALELSEPGTPARVRAIVASAYWDEPQDAEVAEAAQVAEELGDAELQSYLLDVRALASFKASRFAEALDWQRRRFEIEHLITDPDHRSDLRESTVHITLALGRFDYARQLVAEHEEICRTMSAHHRLHTVALMAEIEEMAGGWDAIRALRPRIEAAVAENEATPCVRNARTLLLTAAAEILAGDSGAAAALEEQAESFGMTGFGAVLGGPKLRLAVLHGEPDRVDEFVRLDQDHWRHTFGSIAAMTVRLDALVALDDRERIEREAPRVLVPNTLMEPFALRALGVARRDETLVARAAELFDSLGLAWHAAQTRALL